MNNLLNQITDWQDANFPGADPYQSLLGMMEELGELAHAHLKGVQGIRHTENEIREMKIDALGDILIFMIHYANQHDLSLIDCLERAWKQVKSRNWKERPLTG